MRIIAILIAIALLPPEAQTAKVRPAPRLAEISPPSPLCLALKGRQWRKWVHAQQADGGRWTHACSYDKGVYL